MRSFAEANIIIRCYVYRYVMYKYHMFDVNMQSSCPLAVQDGCSFIVLHITLCLLHTWIGKGQVVCAKIKVYLHLDLLTAKVLVWMQVETQYIMSGRLSVWSVLWWWNPDIYCHLHETCNSMMYWVTPVWFILLAITVV